MYTRITKLSQSPCSQCQKKKKCSKKCKVNSSFLDIKNTIFKLNGFDYHNCGLYISLTAPELVEVEEEGEPSGES